MGTEDILKQGFKEFLEGGLEEEAKDRYRLATTAYFKAITQICDLLIFRKFGKIVSSHSERFRLLERNFPPIYHSVDEIFKSYRDTYTSGIDKRTCDLLKDEIKKIARIGNLKEEFRESLQKI